MLEHHCTKENIGRGSLYQLAAVGPEEDEIYSLSDEIHPLLSHSYKQHTHMAGESKTVPFRNFRLNLDKESKSHIIVRKLESSFIKSMYLHVNLAHMFKTSEITNNDAYYFKNKLPIRMIKRLRVYTDTITLVDVDADGLYILLHSFYNDKPNFKDMIGDYEIDDEKLITKIISQHMYIPIPLWFSREHQQMFPLCLLQDDDIHVSVECDKGRNLVLENPNNESVRIKVSISHDGFDIKLTFSIDYTDTEKNPDMILFSDTDDIGDNFMELMIDYQLPTEHEIHLIHKNEEHEYVAPVIKYVEDDIATGNVVTQKTSPGYGYPSLQTINLPIKTVFFVYKTSDSPFEFSKIDEIMFNEKKINMIEWETITYFEKNLNKIENVYAFSPALHPISCHPSGHFYFSNTNQFIRFKVPNVQMNIKKLKSYAICYNVFTFSQGKLTTVFV